MADQLTHFKTLFKTLGPKQLGMLVVSFLAVVGVVVGSAYWMNTPTYALLVSDADAESVSAVVSKLKEGKISYELADGGRSVRVPAERVDELRLQFASTGLPSAGRIGFEIFDKPAFGTTEFLEQVNYRRALEGELGRTIATLSDVASARVHIAMAKDSVFADKDQAAKASVVLKLRNNRPLSPATVNGITGLVSASVESLRPESVVILDTYGRSLSQSPENGEEATGAAGLDRQQRIEHDLTTRVVSLLEPVVGPGHVRVNVSARLKSDVEDQTEERWDQSPVIRSKQTTTESDARTGTLGTAGARANLPPDLSTSNAAATGAATGSTSTSPNSPTSPTNPATPGNGTTAPANGATPPPAAPPSAVPPTATPIVGTTRSSETTNYEVGKVTTHRTSPGGQIARLSVAVILDEEHAAVAPAAAAGAAAPAAGATPAPAPATATTKPRSPEELQRIQQLVAAAVGLDESRGDKLTVDSIAFDTPTEEPPVPAPSGFSSVWDQVRTSVRDQGMSFVRLFGIAIVALVTIFVVLRPMLRNALKVSAKASLPAAAAPAGLPGRAPTVEEMQGRLDAGHDPLAGAPGLARRVAKLAGDEPEQVARVMRGWIADGGR